MFKDFKKLKRLLKLQEKTESQIRHEGFSRESLRDAIKKKQDDVAITINVLGWVLMFIIFIPLALANLGMSIDTASFISYISAVIIFIFILPKITGRHY